MKKVGTDSGEEAKLTEQKHKEMNELVGLNNISINKNITLLINDWCKEQVRTLHKEYPNTEWLAYCKVIPQGNGVFKMVDMVHPGQVATGGDVETTEEGMAWLNRELISRGERATEWNCVLHSHHHMGCFWSGTDDKARLGLNDGRRLAWAVVTAYDKEGNIDYKGCINFYKPYNIEIDVNVMDENATTVVDRFNEYREAVEKKKAVYYDSLLEANKELIDSLTDKPDFGIITSYLGIDITEDLAENYTTVREQIGNPELLSYLKQLGTQAEELAENEINVGGRYNDMLVEYDAFCNWSDNLLTQLEENKKKNTYVSSIASTTTPTIFSPLDYPSNRDLEDSYYDTYYFNSFECDEYRVRQSLGIGIDVPMRTGACGEWLAWSNKSGKYMYVEDWAEENDNE